MRTALKNISRRNCFKYEKYFDERNARMKNLKNVLIT